VMECMHSGNLRQGLTGVAKQVGGVVGQQSTNKCRPSWETGQTDCTGMGTHRQADRHVCLRKPVAWAPLDSHVLCWGTSACSCVVLQLCCACQ
jgi:hypothetical protein